MEQIAHDFAGIHDHRRLYDRIREAADDFGARRGRRIHAAIEFLLLAPDLFVLLVRLIFDGRVGATEKLLLAAAAVYVLIPFDFLPESVLGGTGYLDDAVLMAYVVAQVLAIADPGVLRELWSGRKEMIDRMA